MNINTTTKEERDRLSGIGSVKAQAIIDSRLYSKPEDIMKVKGIKQKPFDQIKDGSLLGNIPSLLKSSGLQTGGFLSQGTCKQFDIESRCLYNPASDRKGVSMYTSAALAKKLGLEHYLDKPAELNLVIFNLMLLQETIQLEQTRKKRLDLPDSETISIRRIATGKFTVGAMGDARFRYAVETALQASTDVVAVFQRARFVNMLGNIGIPDTIIDTLCETVSIEDDTHCIDPD